MNEEHEQRLAQLQAAYESGALDEDTYQTAVAELEAQYQAQTASGAVAQGTGATAVGERGVNVGGDVGGDIVTGDSFGDIFNNIGMAFGRGAKATFNILHSQESLRRQRNRSAMMEMVHTFWIGGVLEKSLYRATSLHLQLEYRPDAVDNARWDDLMHLPQTDTASLTAPSEIGDIFYAMNPLNRSLLILGAPGAGKTTLLLTLARRALQQAEADPAEPIPVVFNLASWDVKQGSIADWLVAEMTNKYVVPAKIGRPWIDNDDLLLLLDGLDEVETANQAACVKALTRFQQEHGMPMVVCARINEYEQLPRRLQFQTAVFLQALTGEQVDTYVQDAGGEGLAHLRRLLQRDEALLEMAQSPLILNTMMQTFADVSVEELEAPGSREARRHTLFDAYVQRTFQRGSLTELFTKENSMRWLSWLARKMDEHSQAIFLIERLQPGWLLGRGQRWLYLLLSRMIISVISGVCGGVILGLGFSLFFDTTIGLGLRRGLSEGVLSCFVGGLAVVIIDGVRMEWSGRNEPPAAADSYGRLALNILVVATAVYLSVWLAIGGFLGGINWMGGTQAEWYIEGRLVGLLVALCYSFIFGFSTRGSRQVLAEDVQTVEFLSWSRPGAFVGGVYGLLAGMVSGLLMWQFIMSEHPLILLFADERIFLVSVPILTLAGVIFGGLTGRIVQTTTMPNQGVRQSAINAAVWGGTVGMFFGVLGGIIGWLSTSETIAGLTLTAYGAFFGLIAAIWYGGLDVIKHYSLRLILSMDGRMPRRYSRFLNYTVERILLRRVGGGYIFIHRLLADYFAELGER